MERKIGEVFIYNDKLYQVVESTKCDDCAFMKSANCNPGSEILGNCSFITRTDNTSVIFKEIKKYMEIKNNQLTIDIPEGYIIDVENSDLSKGIIKFKNSNITYKDIKDALNLKKDLTDVVCNVNNVTKLSAIDKLINIANYYNKGWKPDWNNSEECKYYILFNNNNKNGYSIEYRLKTNYGNIFFKNEKDAQAVIDNPNFRYILDTIYKN